MARAAVADGGSPHTSTVPRGARKHCTLGARLRSWYRTNIPDFLRTRAALIPGLLQRSKGGLSRLPFAELLIPFQHQLLEHHAIEYRFECEAAFVETGRRQSTACFVLESLLQSDVLLVCGMSPIQKARPCGFQRMRAWEPIGFILIDPPVAGQQIP